MNNMYNVSTSPHVRNNQNTRSIMRDVLIALVPTSVFAVFRFGFNAFLIIVATMTASILAEWLFCKITNRKQTISDLSCLVTGLILALNMPASVPVWIPILGAFFAIIVVKELYGGLGQNFMNPALAARCFLIISFTSSMTNFTLDSVTSATPLYIMNTSENINAAFNYISIKDLFIGNIPGTIGEVSKICLLVGVVYLVIRKIIDLRIPLIYIGTYAIFTFLFGKYNFNIQYVLVELLSGGLIFGAFYMATDYVTSPITKRGRIIFAIILALLTGVFRHFSNSTEGVSYAIILGNILCPFIEKYTIPVAFGMEK